MAVNPSNAFFATGRLTKEPKVFDNSDGSKKVIITLALQDNFKGKDGSRGAQFIDFQAFQTKDAGLGVYAHLGTGDLVNVVAEARNNNWTAADGTPHYDMILRITSLNMLESKRVTAARHGAEETAAAEATVSVPEGEDLASVLG